MLIQWKVLVLRIFEISKDIFSRIVMIIINNNKIQIKEKRVLFEKII